MLLNIQALGKVPGDTVKGLLQLSLQRSGSRHNWKPEISLIEFKSVLRTIVRMGKVVEHFVGTIARCVCQPPEMSVQRQPDSDPELSAAETHRIQYAL